MSSCRCWKINVWNWNCYLLLLQHRIVTGFITFTTSTFTINTVTTAIINTNSINRQHQQCVDIQSKKVKDIEVHVAGTSVLLVKPSVDVVTEARNSHLIRLQWAVVSQEAVIWRSFNSLGFVYFPAKQRVHIKQQHEIMLRSFNVNHMVAT